MAGDDTDRERMSLGEIRARLDALEQMSAPTDAPVEGTDGGEPSDQQQAEVEAALDAGENRAIEFDSATSEDAEKASMSRPDRPIPERAESRPSKPVGAPRLRLVTPQVSSTQEDADDTRRAGAAEQPAAPETPRARDLFTGRGTGLPSPGRLTAKPPEPVDISARDDDETDVLEPPVTRSRQVDFRTLAMVAIYLAIVLFAIAAAIYI